MCNQGKALWRQLMCDTSKESLLRTALNYTRYGFNQLIGHSLDILRIQVSTYSLQRVVEYTQSPEAETVAVHLRIGDTLPGQAILVLSMPDAMQIVNWLMDDLPDPITELNALASSALAETGNVLLASFLNALSQLTRQSILLSPPTVVVDMLATILEVVVTNAAPFTNELTIIETEFQHTESDLRLRFWMLPELIDV